MLCTVQCDECQYHTYIYTTLDPYLRGISEVRIGHEDGYLRVMAPAVPVLRSVQVSRSQQDVAQHLQSFRPVHGLVRHEDRFDALIVLRAHALCVLVPRTQQRMLRGKVLQQHVVLEATTVSDRSGVFALLAHEQDAIVLVSLAQLFEGRVRGEDKVTLRFNIELLAQYVGFDLLRGTSVIRNKDERAILAWIRAVRKSS